MFLSSELVMLTYVITYVQEVMILLHFVCQHNV